MRRVFLLTCSLFAAMSAPSHAQRVATVGDWVRVRAATSDEVGTVRAISPAGIEIVDEDRVVHFFAQEAIRDVSVSLGEELQAGKKGWAAVAMLGITGAGVGIAAGTWSPCEDEGEWFGCFLHPGSRTQAALVGGLIALPLALVVANGIGSDRMVDIWAEASMPTGPSAWNGLTRSGKPGAVSLVFSIPVRPIR